MQPGSTVDRALDRELLRIEAGVLGLSCALLCGLGFFVSTVWLVLKGGPNMGAHLQLLNQYFVGYSVSWTGSLLGFVYGALIGGAAGWAIGSIYNAVVRFRCSHRE